ncbi:MAG: hypothetical protein Q9162_006732 [Coniocarpon cinnabarinum]
MPSWTPYYGHLATHLRDFGKVLKQVREFTKSKDPCSILLGGKEMCVIVSSKDADYIHKSSSGFEHQEAIRGIGKEFRITKQGVKQLWSTRDGYARNAVGHLRHKNTFTELMSYTTREISAFGRVDGLPIEIINQMWTMSPEELLPPRIVSAGKGGHQLAPLSRWVRGIVAQISSEAFWGSAMLRINPQFKNALYAFDDRVWMILSHVPLPWSARTRIALHLYQKAIAAYLVAPRSERHDASPLQKLYEECLTREEVKLTDMAAVHSMMFWG